MEYSSNQFDRAKFDAVWKRVKPEMALNMKDLRENGRYSVSEDCDRLRGFMDGESCDAEFYGMLALKCSGCARQMLLRISADEQGHLKKLRAKYFILTGETYKPPNACPLIRTVPDALRRKYSGEKEGSVAYRTAAEDAADTDLKDTYLALSADEARHSKAIGCIIETLF